ncbi:hypothetical protein HNR21_002561 [Actinomadura cellulosilytica]|uniref:Uncharacterized protein n=1 Tax=Thermomonospora cellulosilytica TaxID=1411118 RepID=A0A7W3MXI9_9ACTN|nr:hypothetical protein [Thermomonospora cellulosilytica]
MTSGAEDPACARRHHPRASSLHAGQTSVTLGNLEWIISAHRPARARGVALWWRDAVWVVIGLSLYANFIGEFSAYQAARAEEAGEGS